MRLAVLLLLCAVASGCATLQPHQEWAPNYSAGCGAADPAPGQYRKANCDAVSEARTRAQYYARRASSIGREEAVLAGLSVTALVATAGFSVFDAHPDNIRAAALIAATTEGTRRTLAPVKRRDIYGLAFRRAACVQASAAPFLEPEVDEAHRKAERLLPQLRDAITVATKELLPARKVLLADAEFLLRYDINPGALSKVDPGLRSLRGPALQIRIAELREEIAKLTALIERAEKAYKEGLAGAGAIERAPMVIRTEMSSIEEEASKQIAALQVDVSKFLETLTKDFTANLDAAKKIAEAGARVEASDATATLEQLVVAVEALTLKSFADASGAVATCRQKVTEPKAG